ncbi:MAG: hypothetical protein KatS3mg078_0061 [Deltaproteobacteria bacterium]|nr:MAG: hypothetical protein KatS3mg078_0061 [Deltaproteobacteria bacterium]
MSSQENNNRHILQEYRRLLIKSESQKTRLSMINEISNTINSLTNLEEIFKAVVSKLKWILDYDSCSICVLSKDKNQYTIYTCFDSKKTSLLETTEYNWVVVLQVG